MDKDLLTIGAFASRARLSAKALRLYDRLGLLRPAYVDEVSGYRYYRAGQTERARLVALLRQLDMPLARIAEVVEAPESDAAALLAAYWDGAEARFASQRALAGYLRGRLSGRSSEMYEKFVVETAEVPEQVVLSETRHVLAPELPVWIPGSLGRLEQGAGESGGITGSPFVVYHAEVSVESDGPAESCVPVADEAAARPGRSGRAGPPGHGSGWSRAARRLRPDHQGAGRPPADPRRLRGRRALGRRAGADRRRPVPGDLLRRLGRGRAGDPVCDVAFPVR